MKEYIRENALRITKFIDDILIDNEIDSSFINEVEFKFSDKKVCYKEKEFLEILDNYFTAKNISYEMKEVKEGTVYFKIRI